MSETGTDAARRSNVRKAAQGDVPNAWGACAFGAAHAIIDARSNTPKPANGRRSRQGVGLKLVISRTRSPSTSFSMSSNRAILSLVAVISESGSRVSQPEPLPKIGDDRPRRRPPATAPSRKRASGRRRYRPATPRPGTLLEPDAMAGMSTFETSISQPASIASPLHFKPLAPIRPGWRAPIGAGPIFGKSGARAFERWETMRSGVSGVADSERVRL